MSDLRSPLSKVKGLGSAKEGTTHFWRQRLTALLLIPLVLWIGFSLAALPVDHATLVGWIQQPWVSVALVLLVIVTFYHAQLGLQIIIEDYISSHS
jgi:succinate dehydrogenase / fumarate reductase membrane anchor subunit